MKIVSAEGRVDTTPGSSYQETFYWVCPECETTASRDVWSEERWSGACEVKTVECGSCEELHGVKFE